jgi:hypothetical protein
MPADDDSTRRSVVPPAAGRSLWLAAIWTGVGTAVVCAIAAVVLVAICWLPAAGASGSGTSATSAVKAGLLTFLASLHGGITVDGTPAHFVPLGMTIIVGLAAWRAGAGLADAADALRETDLLRLGLAGTAQLASFAVAALVMVPLAELGTSDAPFLGVGAASIVLFAATGGIAFVRASPLSDRVSLNARGLPRLPGYLRSLGRPAAAAVSVYLGMGALLVAGSIVVHHGQVQALSGQVGDGWGGVPILLLGLLAAPNAVIAGSAYLAGPGFAVGSGATTSAFTTSHGVLPAFPLLGAMPQGSGASTIVWWVMGATPLLAGLAVARVALGRENWLSRLRVALLGAALAGVVMAVLAWQGGGSVGDGRLHTVGASPWLLGCAVAAATSVLTAVTLAGTAAWRWIDSEQAPRLSALLESEDSSAAPDRPDDAPRTAVDRGLRVAVARPLDADEGDRLAG